MAFKILKFKKFIIIGSLALLLVAAHLLISPDSTNFSWLWGQMAKTSDLDNVSGYAHTETSDSWISFNCNSAELVDIFTFTFPMYFSFPPCSDNDFGVNGESDGSFTGYALSDAYGWIDFLPATSSPPIYSSSTGLVTGYAHIISLGSSGWMQLHERVGEGKDGVSIDYITGDFSGYGWNPTAGWVSFNCIDESYCATTDYKVNMYIDLTTNTMSAPNWSVAQSCNSSADRAVVRWTLIGDPQTAYQVIIDDDSVRDDDSPVWDTGKVTSVATQYACPNGFDSCDLDHNTSYYWWVRFWDTHNATSTWTQFDASEVGHTLTDNVAYNTVQSPAPDLTFTTYRHEFPEPYFSWDPVDVQVGSSTLFTSNVYYYDDANPDSNASTCSGSNCGYLWTDGIYAIIANATAPTTTIIFTQIQDVTVTLTATDPDAYTCATTSPLINVNLNPPIWKEIKPEQ